MIIRKVFNKYNRKCKFKTIDDIVYDGDWLDGKPHGKGWKDGKFVGKQGVKTNEP